MHCFGSCCSLLSCRTRSEIENRKLESWTLHILKIVVFTSVLYDADDSCVFSNCYPLHEVLNAFDKTQIGLICLRFLVLIEVYIHIH